MPATFSIHVCRGNKIGVYSEGSVLSISVSGGDVCRAGAQTVVPICGIWFGIGKYKVYSLTDSKSGLRGRPD